MADEQTPDPGADERSPEVNFTAFVLSLAHTAAIHFGDVPDPATGEKAETNLVAARQMIDVLSLLEEKTRGNLTPEERQILEQLLYELRLRAVEGPSTSPIIQP